LLTSFHFQLKPLHSDAFSGTVAFSERLLGAEKCKTPKWNSPCPVIVPYAPKHDLWVGRIAPLKYLRRRRGFTGMLDDIRIYANVSLSAKQVRALYEDGCF
jgi:hypothetical protein